MNSEVQMQEEDSQNMKNDVSHDDNGGELISVKHSTEDTPIVDEETKTCESGEIKKPSKYVPPYLWYASEHQIELDQRNNKSMRRCAEGWIKLPQEEKDRYKTLAQADAKRFSREMKEYREATSGIIQQGYQGLQPYAIPLNLVNESAQNNENTFGMKKRGRPKKVPSGKAEPVETQQPPQDTRGTSNSTHETSQIQEGTSNREGDSTDPIMESLEQNLNIQPETQTDGAAVGQIDETPKDLEIAEENGAKSQEIPPGESQGSAALDQEENSDSALQKRGRGRPAGSPNKSENSKSPHRSPNRKAMVIDSKSLDAFKLPKYSESDSELNEHNKLSKRQKVE